jgi:hypothetical protein
MLTRDTIYGIIKVHLKSVSIEILLRPLNLCIKQGFYQVYLINCV